MSDFDKELDTSGLNCPLPIIKAKKEIKWKIQVYNAIIRSESLYGLETIQLTKPKVNRLDAFQMRGLSRILKTQPTLEDRTRTNEKNL